MTRFSSNALTARLLAQQGIPSETVQSWRGKVRHDLFGVGDTVALCTYGLRLIQNCSYGTLKEHRDTINESAHIGRLDALKVPIDIWEWRRKKVGRKLLWFVRTQERRSRLWLDVSDWDGPHDLYPKTTKGKA